LQFVCLSETTTTTTTTNITIIMGNVNGNPSEQHQEEEEEEAVAATVSLNGGDGIIDNNNSMMMMMTHSPPTSPRATHSPLIFTPQVPAVPLQRPDEMHPPIHHSSSAYEHISTQHTIPTMITWTYGAKLIFVQGSWDNWKSRTPLQRSGKDFAIMKVSVWCLPV
jgi:5'-AMP-activated protein kinase regulatory beta subunit